MRTLRVFAAVCLSFGFACSSSSSTGSFLQDGGSSKGSDSGTAATEEQEENEDGGTSGTLDASKKDSATTVDAAKEAAAEPKDVAGSAECDAYCAKVESCGSTCVPSTDCKVASGKCAAAVRDFLGCQASTGQWYCGSSGFSVVHNCQYDATLCQ